jgi:hypothetical protein
MSIINNCNFHQLTSEFSPIFAGEHPISPRRRGIQAARAQIRYSAGRGRGARNGKQRQKDLGMTPQSLRLAPVSRYRCVFTNLFDNFLYYVFLIYRCCSIYLLTYSDIYIYTLLYTCVCV